MFSLLNNTGAKLAALGFIQALGFHLDVHLPPIPYLENGISHLEVGLFSHM